MVFGAYDSYPFILVEFILMIRFVGIVKSKSFVFLDLIADLCREPCVKR